ncbi:MAG: outer membrane beta-barrel protein [Crocinitomicaceae bacterium]
MKKILFLMILLCGISLLPNRVLAQASYVSAGYRVAFPMASFRDYIKTTSFRGVQLDYKYFVNDNVAVGFQWHWNGFYENKPRQTYYFDQGAVTAEQFNFSYASNLLLGIDYYISTKNIVKPFFGAKGGMGYLEIDRFIGAAQLQETVWRFSYSATAGALFQIPNTSLGFTLEGSWNQVLFDNVHYKHMSSVGLFIGFCYSGQFKDL